MGLTSLTRGLGQRIVLIMDIAQWQLWQSAWDDLLRHSTAFEARLFLSHEWLTTWWQHLGRGSLLVIAVADGDHLLAAAPLFVAPSFLLPMARLVRLIGNGKADYGDFLVRQGCEEVAGQIWRWLFAHRSLWHLVALHELPEESVALATLRELTLPPHIAVCELQGEVCHRILLNAVRCGQNESGSWRLKATKRLQQQLKRRERQISQTFEVRFEKAETPEEVDRALEQLFALHRLRWGQLGQTGVFLSPKVRRFHHAFAQKALRRGWLRLHLLFLNGAIAAAYYAFHCDGYAGFYTCGFHPAFARYSVGKVLLAKVIDAAEGEGAQVFDFMRGNETYKAEFGTIAVHNRHLFVWQSDKALSRLAARCHRFTTRLTLHIKTAAQR